MKRCIALLALAVVVVPTSVAQDGGKGSFRIRGVVLNAVTSAPVPRAEVSLFSNTEETKTTAGGDGQFAFEGVESGKYPIYAEARGYVREGWNQHGAFLTAVVVGAGLDSEHVVFRLHQQAMIHGQVTNERGEAVRQAQVMLFTENDDRGTMRTTMHSQTQTNDLGEYRFAHLTAGRYRVGVTARPWYAQTGSIYAKEATSSDANSGQLQVFSRAQRPKPNPVLDVVYPVTFYPGVTNDQDAAELDLSAGEAAEANVQLQAVPAVHLRLTNLPATERGGFNVSASQKLFGSMDVGEPAEVMEVAPGEYEVAGLPPGNVRLQVERYGSGERESRVIHVSASDGASVDAGGNDTTVGVKGRVLFPSGTAPLGVTQLVLMGEDSRNSTSKLSADGTFSLEGVHPGTYRVAMNTLRRQGGYLQKIVAKGAKADGDQIVITGEANVELEITMSRGVGQVRGTAQLDGKPAAGVMILLLTETGKDVRENYRMDQSDSDGTFGLGSIIPGKYLLMAIADAWDLEWSKPGALKPYREKAQVLEIAANEMKKVTVEVQARVK